MSPALRTHVLRLVAAAAWAVALAAPGARAAETISTVDTVFKFIGPDHKILVEA